MARKQTKAVMTTYIRPKKSGFIVRLVDKRGKPLHEVGCTRGEIVEAVSCARDRVGISK